MNAANSRSDLHPDFAENFKANHNECRKSCKFKLNNADFSMHFHVIFDVKKIYRKAYHNGYYPKYKNYVFDFGFQFLHPLFTVL